MHSVCWSKKAGNARVSFSAIREREPREHAVRTDCHQSTRLGMSPLPRRLHFLHGPRYTRPL